MDDSHIFCAAEQVPDELGFLLSFVLDLLRDFGLSDFYLELSTRPEDKAFGTDEEWAVATEALRVAAQAAELELVMDEGGGAFYGPKISVQARDAIGRTHQMSTIQLDFQLPQRFGLEYVGSDNGRHRPVMIHRALFGSVERFMAILLEHYAGALPTWLMPEQVRVLPVKADVEPYADEVVARLVAAGLRASAEAADSGVGARVARAKVQKIPYVVVVGDSDVAATTVGVNRRGSNDPERDVPLDRFVDDVVAEVAARTAGPQPEGIEPGE
jgi:threonyl-tRNA synthetase